MCARSACLCAHLPMRECGHILCVHMYKSIHVWVHTYAGFLILIACMHIHINMHRCGHICVQTLYMYNVVCTFVVCVPIGTGVYMCMLMCTFMPG